MNQLLAFHNDPILRARTIDKAEWHRDQDNFVQGHYWSNGKGCAVGCLLQDPDGAHHRYEAEFGIPEALAHLEERIFEGMSVEQSKAWPLRFLNAIPCGADLSMVSTRVLIRILQDLKFDRAGYPDVAKSVDDTIALLQRRVEGEDVEAELLKASARAAEAAWVAWVAWAAGAAGAAEAAWAAEAAEAAGAARAARAAWAAGAAEAARAKFYEDAANWLTEELAAAPIPTDTVIVICKRGDTLLLDGALAGFPPATVSV